jgi:hypothetical protein
VLVYSLTARLPVRFITLLLPSHDVAAAPPAISPLVEDGSLRGVILDHGREVIRVDDLVPSTA